MKSEHRNNIIAFLTSLIGTCFLIYYIFRASTDIVSGDYLRIVYYYLEDVFDLKYLLSWEGISRIPFTFLARIINVVHFGYSVYFDKILGTIGTFIFNFVAVKYALNKYKSKHIQIISTVVIALISFSLMPWEMYLNGTGYAHILCMGFFALIFYLYDRMIKRTETIMTLENLDASDLQYYGNEKENNKLSNMLALIDTSEVQRKNLNGIALIYLLTAVVSVCFAGAYQVGFLSTIIFISIIEIFIFVFMRNKYNKGEIDQFGVNELLYYEFKQQFNSEEIRTFGKYKGEKYSTVNNESTFKIFFKLLILIVISLVCISCYFKSNGTGEPLVPVGAHDVSFFEVLSEDVRFPIRFLLKSFASAIFGTETFGYAIMCNTISEKMIYFVGVLYIFVIVVTLTIILGNFLRDKNNKNIFDINSYTDLFPIFFIILGFGNFILVLLERYKMMLDNYGMTSRYGIQYIFLTMGMIFIIFSYIDEAILKKTYIKRQNASSKKNDNAKLNSLNLTNLKKLSVVNIIKVIICVLAILVLTIGHMTTTMDEIYKADFRKIVYTNLENIAKNYDDYSDKELMDSFEYHRDNIRESLDILKRKKLNIFREDNNNKKQEQ